MTTEVKNTEPSMTDKAEMIRTLIDLMNRGFGKEIYALAEEKLIKILKEI